MNYYAGVYQGRWPALQTALEMPGSGVGLHCLPEGGYSIVDAPGTDDPDSGLSECSDSLGNGGGNAAPHKIYRLDRTSVMAAESMVLPAKGRILDACAAPGGKSLVIAARMTSGSRLVANELSAERRRRLKLVLSEHLPRSISCHIEVTGYDAASLCRRRPAEFDAILLDAPCSSERHLIGDPEKLAEWSPARTRNLACRQWALLSSAFLMLASGGCLVYATCSISPEENDGVAGRLLKKYSDEFSFIPPDFPLGEQTRFGHIFLPDACEGSGPLYISRIKKR